MRNDINMSTKIKKIITRGVSIKTISRELGVSKEMVLFWVNY